MMHDDHDKADGSSNQALAIVLVLFFFFLEDTIATKEMQQSYGYV